MSTLQRHYAVAGLALAQLHSRLMDTTQFFIANGQQLASFLHGSLFYPSKFYNLLGAKQRHSSLIVRCSFTLAGDKHCKLK